MNLFSRIAISLAAIAAALALAAPPCEAQNQSVTYEATFEPGQSHDLLLWGAQPGQDATQDAALELDVPVSPFGAQTQAVRAVLLYNGRQVNGGIENGGSLPLFAYHSQTSCTALLRTAPTRRVGPQPVASPGFTYVSPSGVDIASYDGAWNNAGASGETWNDTSCALDQIVTLTRAANPIAVSRFCTSHPGHPGRVHLQLVPQVPLASWWANGPNGEPRGPTNYGHAWWSGDMWIENVRVFVIYFNFVPAQ